MVFSIEASPQRVAWFEIPEIAKAHNDIQEAVRKGTVNAAQEAFTIFKRITLTSTDLLTNDAINLVHKVETRLEQTLEAFGTTTREKLDFPSLNEIQLYE